MTRTENWSPFLGSGSLILTMLLLVITAALVVAAWRLSRPICFRRPGALLGAYLIVTEVLAVVLFLVAITAYTRELVRQWGHYTGAKDPITPVTLSVGILTFVLIVAMSVASGRSRFWPAFGSAIVGTIAAPLIFELPFDLIVMWHTFPPDPAPLFTLLFFLPLFIIEVTSFALLTLSPLVRVSRVTLLLLAGMFCVFAVWAMFGFTYPSAPFPIAMNILAKILAFAVAASLFLPRAGDAPRSVEGAAGSVTAPAIAGSPNRAGLL